MKQFKYQALKSILMMVTIAGFLEINGCYYDDEDNLYPQIGGCDTSNVTYSVTIAGIMTSNCNSCHSGSTPSGNLKTDNYTDLKTIADNGKFWGAVNHETGFSPMPKDRPQLSDCDLRKIRIWIDNGSLNN